MDINYKVKTNKTFQKATADLKKALADHKFGVLWELNFKDKLAEKQLDFDRNFNVLEVCNPAMAKKALETNIEVGYFLPCKMVVFENYASVYIGMLKPTGIIGMMGNQEMSGIAQEVENVLLSAINDALN